MFLWCCLFSVRTDVVAVDRGIQENQLVGHITRPDNVTSAKFDTQHERYTIARNLASSTCRLTYYRLPINASLSGRHLGGNIILWATVEIFGIDGGQSVGHHRMGELPKRGTVTSAAQFAHRAVSHRVRWPTATTAAISLPTRKGPNKTRASDVSIHILCT